MTDAAESPLLVEVGWILAGRLNEADRRAVEQARESVLGRLREALPRFTWRFPVLHREELTGGGEAEPVGLLDAGVTERNVKRWDYTLLITEADLVSYYKSDALAVISRSMEAAVISTSRIDPRATGERGDEEERVALMTRRVVSLVMYVFARLNGLPRSEEPHSFARGIEQIEDLDGPQEFLPEELAELEESLLGTADRRLEEREGGGPNPLLFYPAAAWINRGDILRAIIEARPWQFPYRLSRLTVAAVSAMMVLLITAEAWDLGMSQDGWVVAGLSIAAVTVTTVYVLLRQRLFVRRAARRMSEQTVVVNISTVAVVLAGMVTTYALLFGLSLFIATTLFHQNLVKNWAASEAVVGVDDYVILAAFVASLGVFIGSLGASFEQQNYFRHITFVDEEV